MAKATQLTQASGRLLRVASLIVVQASICGSNKYMLLKYLAKNSINEIINTLSDEDKRKECEY